MEAKSLTPVGGRGGAKAGGRWGVEPQRDLFPPSRFFPMLRNILRRMLVRTGKGDAPWAKALRHKRKPLQKSTTQGTKTYVCLHSRVFAEPLHRVLRNCPFLRARVMRQSSDSRNPPWSQLSWHFSGWDASNMFWSLSPKFFSRFSDRGWFATFWDFRAGSCTELDNVPPESKTGSTGETPRSWNSWPPHLPEQTGLVLKPAVCSQGWSLGAFSNVLIDWLIDWLGCSWPSSLSCTGQTPQETCPQRAVEMKGRSSFQGEAASQLPPSHPTPQTSKEASCLPDCPFSKRNQKLGCHNSIRHIDNKSIFEQQPNITNTSAAWTWPRVRPARDLWWVKRLRGTNSEGKILASTRALPFCRSKVSFHKYCWKHVYGFKTPVFDKQFSSIL